MQLVTEPLSQLITCRYISEAVLVIEKSSVDLLAIKLSSV